MSSLGDWGTNPRAMMAMVKILVSCILAVYGLSERMKKTDV